eukprot:1989391-Pyramimonas_sp.AAC.1
MFIRWKASTVLPCVRDFLLRAEAFQYLLSYAQKCSLYLKPLGIAGSLFAHVERVFALIEPPLVDQPAFAGWGSFAH